jgi:multidrug efflux pump subunit AcrA (membrane-fusion protein)
MSVPDPEKTPVVSTEQPLVSGWMRVVRGNRLLWIVAAASAVCLTAGYAGGAMLSSAGAAEVSTKGGPITVPVESLKLTNTVKLRGDAAFDDAVEVKVASGELGGPAVVTGAVPQVGSTLDALSVALEVVGRPVIVLPGALPAYRTLRAGHSGPDVVQLKGALRGVGLNPGDSDVYDSTTANAVAALYDKVGYSAPPAGPDSKAAVQSAKQAVASAESTLESAQRDLATASMGADAAKQVELDNAVRAAERDLREAQAAGDRRAAATAEDALRLARTQRDLGLAAPDTSSQAEAVQSARRQLEAARTELGTATTDAITPLPANEVQFLPTLPRRVDEVRTERGKALEGAAMVVSGVTVSITAPANEADAKLLRDGLTGSVVLPDGKEAPVTVTSVTAHAPDNTDKEKAAATPKWDVLLAPTSLTPEQTQQVRGRNVRVSIPVTATKGKVLVVPSAALSAGPGGETRVEVAAKGGSRLVPVTTGLAADGLVEITGKISAHDRVVVGK